MVNSDNRLLARVDELIAIMDDPKAAYVVRSRLDRLLLMLHSSPGLPAGALRDEVAESLEHSFRALRRRSEPFGEGWVRKLADTRAELVSLRGALTAAENRSPGQ